MLRSARLAVLALLLLATVSLAQDRGRGRGGGPSMWERMSRHDADGDGRVTREEFSGPDRFFDAMDGDGDGAVTREEVESRSRSMGGRSRGMRGVGAGTGWIFRRLDRNGDGRFDESDLVAIAKLADEDGDGSLSESEMNEYLKDRADGLRAGSAPEEGKPAPMLVLTPLDGRKKVLLTDLLAKGRPVVLAFGSFT